MRVIVKVALDVAEGVDSIDVNNSLEAIGEYVSTAIAEGAIEFCPDTVLAEAPLVIGYEVEQDMF